MAKSAISAEDQDYIKNEMMKKEDSRPTFNIKTVFINRDTVDADGKEIPMDTFSIKGSSIFSRSIRFRPLGYYNNFIRTVQGTDKKWKTESQTILYQMGEEAIDSTGGLKCGKITGKAIPAEWTEAEKLKNKEKAKFYGYLFGVVEFPKSEPQVAMIRLPSAKAIDVSKLFNTIGEKNSMAQYMLDMKLIPVRGGKYPEMEVALDTSKELPLHEVIGAHKEIRTYITFFNNSIKRLRQQVLNARQQKISDEVTMESILGLDEDFNDEE